MTRLGLDRMITLAPPSTPKPTEWTGTGYCSVHTHYVDSGVAAVLGAVIGAAGSAAATWVTARFSHRQTRAQIAAVRGQWLLENRRSAYQDLIASARQFENAWWELGDALEADRDSQEMFVRIIALYPQLAACEAGVQILGPLPAADSARILIRHLRNLDTAGTAWYRATDRATFDEQRERFWALHGASASRLEAFCITARTVFEAF